MLVIPAIDLRDGKVVRLTRGDFNQETVYSDDPVSFALDFVKQGAQRIHVVDLEGALLGELKNLEYVKKIAQSVKVPIEFGGGIRKIRDIQKILDFGVSCVILGTKAIEDSDFLAEASMRFKGKIAVSLDTNRNFLMQQGWTKLSGTSISMDSDKMFKNFENMGVSLLIYTDISRDGTLEGPNFEGLKNLLKLTKIPVIASGGVSCLKDVEKLNQTKGLFGAIIGKAIYENKINLKDAIDLCSPKE